MKKTLFTLAVCIGISGFAQEEESTTKDISNRKHELRIDALEALAIPNIEINYEYVISKYSGIGAAISFDLSNKRDDFNSGNYQNFAFTPYYRQYFLNKKEYGARGLFVEGMLQFASGDDYTYDFLVDSTGNSIQTGSSDNWFNAGVGLAIGQKWVSNNGFIFELSAGGGRYVLDTESSPDAFFRGGVLVGYRF